MKTTLLSVAATVAALGLSMSTNAASPAPAVEQTGSAVQTPAVANAPRHSHMGEKIGVRAEQAASSGSEAAKPTPEKTAANRHNHQRDFK
ncbi:hypothetical protein LLG90_10145 [Aromatoleum toluclasticum]|uniref:hypothetical protein n=1 Tax=Aromatoleum toluclasticum TaxID=92003 RepID=UPI001D1873A6|nr:hypothetical protein [Aromatoleum toluclasticum]MCC4115708.1 hypothetical protein [Aromatoleum toluclasticum]